MLGEAGFIIWKWAKKQTSRQDTSTIGTLQDHVIYNTKIKAGSEYICLL